MRYMSPLYLLVACLLGTPCLAQTTATGSEPQAIFKRLQDFVASNSLDFQTTFNARDVALGTVRGSAHFLIQRPNLFRIEASRGHTTYILVSDGQTMTIYNPQEQKFTQLRAPATPADGLSLLTGLASVQTQILRLVGLIRDVADGTKGTQVTAAGSSTIGDRLCDRFSIVESRYTSAEERWDVWLEHKDVPLPCKFVVSDGVTYDVQTNEFNWKLNPVLSPEMFKFNPPTGSKKVESFGALNLQPPH
jgi:outer membrane lipoprotein-sorting protein